MSIVVPNISEVLLLSIILGKQNNINSQTLKLFKNSIVIDKNTVLENFVEADESGYSSIAIVPEDWNIIQESNSVIAVCNQKQFSFNSAATIYGYYIVSDNNFLMWAERFSYNNNNQFYQLPEGGGNITITPKISIN